MLHYFSDVSSDFAQCSERFWKIKKKMQKLWKSSLLKKTPMEVFFGIHCNNFIFWRGYLLVFSFNIWCQFTFIKTEKQENWNFKYFWFGFLKPLQTWRRHARRITPKRKKKNALREPIRTEKKSHIKAPKPPTLFTSHH